MKTYTLNNIEKQIKKLQAQKEMILNLDLDKVPTLEDWEEISSISFDERLLISMVNKIFPKATNIIRQPNEIFFYYDKLKLGLTTGKYVRLTVYNLTDFRPPVKPIDQFDFTDCKIQQYFSLLDAGADCFTLAKYRYKVDYKPNVFKIIYDHYFKKVDRQKWEERWKRLEEQQASKEQEYKQKMEYIQECRENIKNSIVELSEFCEVYYKLGQFGKREKIIVDNLPDIFEYIDKNY